MTKIKPKHSNIIYIIGVVLVIVALAIFISIRLSTGPKPKIASFDINEHILTITPEDESLNLAYCAAKTPSPSNCEWDNMNEFYLTLDNTYYAFIKNVDTGAISDPETIEYK